MHDVVHHPSTTPLSLQTKGLLDDSPIQISYKFRNISQIHIRARVFGMQGRRYLDLECASSCGLAATTLSKKHRCTETGRKTPGEARGRRTSMGRNNVNTAETMNKAAETKTGLGSRGEPTRKSRRSKGKRTDPFAVLAETVPVPGVVAILMSGAMNPPIRFSAAQRASPVPRWGAANDSGV